MAERSCFFCKKSTHVSEYCRDFPTLRSRYAYLFKHKLNSCLCPKYEPLIVGKENSMCKCKRICEACFQHHHISMCPKRDIDHPSYTIIFPEPLCLFYHHSPFVKRFFELCNPVNKFRLQSCCKYYKKLQQPLFILNPSFNCKPPTSQADAQANVVFNKSLSLREWVFIKGEIVKNVVRANPYQCNFDNISLEKCYITKKDLKIFAKSDPHTVYFKYCTFEDLLTLYDILEAFPYAYDITYLAATIPETWILNFLCVERKVSLRQVTVEDRYLEFNIDDMIMLLEQNEDLTVTVLTYAPFTSTRIKQLETHSRFIHCKSTEPNNLCIVFNVNGSKTCFRLKRL